MRGDQSKIEHSLPRLDLIAFAVCTCTRRSSLGSDARDLPFPTSNLLDQPRISPCQTFDQDLPSPSAAEGPTPSNHD